MNTVRIFGTNRALLPMLARLVLVVGATCAIGDSGIRDDATAIRVSYSRDQIATPQGAATLYRQIRSAASKVCRSYESDELFRQIVWQRCISRTVANAVAAVHQPALTALHERQTGLNRRG